MSWRMNLRVWREDVLAEKAGTFPDTAEKGNLHHMLSSIFTKPWQRQRKRMFQYFHIAIVCVHQFLTSFTDIDPMPLWFGRVELEIDRNRRCGPAASHRGPWWHRRSAFDDNSVTLRWQNATKHTVIVRSLRSGRHGICVPPGIPTSVHIAQ